MIIPYTLSKCPLCFVREREDACSLQLFEIHAHASGSLSGFEDVLNGARGIFSYSEVSLFASDAASKRCRDTDSSQWEGDIKVEMRHIMPRIEEIDVVITRLDYYCPVCDYRLPGIERGSLPDPEAG